ncbi:MAG: DnaJ domain-containing protein [Bacteroidota bacterium]
MQGKDYYKILELPPSATLQEIKTAYRRLAHQYHPDKNDNDLYAAAQFEMVKEAYEVLSDPRKKNTTSSSDGTIRALIKRIRKPSSRLLLFYSRYLNWINMFQSWIYTGWIKKACMIISARFFLMIRSES